MNGTPTEPNTKALEFISTASIYLLIVTVALLAWVSSAVEFSDQSLRLAAMACLMLSTLCGVGTLALIPLVQEARRPGQSNFDVEVRYALFGSRGARLRSTLLPQYLLLLAGLVLYVAGMIQ